MVTSSRWQALLNAAFPTLEDGITLEAAEQFVQQQPAVNFVNKLSQYHGSSARIGLLGDAAHCTGGASGQVCQSIDALPFLVYLRVGSPAPTFLLSSIM
ncbi:MAG: hypothetical protein ACPIOQ_51810 [Promethearchaeia archaeon]